MMETRKCDNRIAEAADAKNKDCPSRHLLNSRQPLRVEQSGIGCGKRGRALAQFLETSSLLLEEGFFPRRSFVRPAPSMRSGEDRFGVPTRACKAESQRADHPPKPRHRRQGADPGAPVGQIRRAGPSLP
jgi:hypothetical protein